SALRGERHRAMDGGDVPHLPPGPLRRAAGGRLWRPQGRAEGIRPRGASRPTLAPGARRGLASLPHGRLVVPVAQPRAVTGEEAVRRAAARLGAMAIALALVGAAPSPVHVNGGRLKDLLLGLAEFGKNPEGGVTRVAFSREDQAARDWLIERMKEAGLEVGVDPAANIHGRRPGGDGSRPVILFGSHIDSVPNGGNFDGDVGSMGALEVM